MFLSAYVFVSGNAPSKPEAVTLALRSAGHQLLLADGNETSRVLPIIKSQDDWLEISFDTSISIKPDSLVGILNTSLQKANLPMAYWAEVKEVKSDAVVYSYFINENESDAASIIPCFGRNLPKDRYTVNVKLSTKESQSALLLPSGVFSILMLSVFLFVKKGNMSTPMANNSIGSYEFQKERRKLIHENIATDLTEKEAELLDLFCINLNRAISREELERVVWESKGVYVSRSLDTYVSKLRKKLDRDSRIAIKNIHGFGYKLEVFT